MINCTRCDSTGFLNLEQCEGADEMEIDDILAWVVDPKNQPHDVQVCDCCGDGEGWYGEPGQHDVISFKREFGRLPDCY